MNSMKFFSILSTHLAEPRRITQEDAGPRSIILYHMICYLVFGILNRNFSCRIRIWINFTYDLHRPLIYKIYGNSKICENLLKEKALSNVTTTVYFRGAAKLALSACFRSDLKEMCQWSFSISLEERNSRSKYGSWRMNKHFRNDRWKRGAYHRSVVLRD